MKNRYDNWYLYLAIIWALLVLYALLKPSSEIPQTLMFNIPHVDKIAHFTMFFGQFWLTSLVFIKAQKKIPFWRLLWGALIFAIVTEILQETLTLDRTGEIGDVIADVLGALSALLILKWRLTGRN